MPNEGPYGALRRFSRHAGMSLWLGAKGLSIGRSTRGALNPSLGANDSIPGIEPLYDLPLAPLPVADVYTATISTTSRRVSPAALARARKRTSTSRSLTP